MQNIDIDDDDDDNTRLSCSSCSSHSYDSDSSAPEWENDIRDDGELVYIVSEVEVKQDNKVEDTKNKGLVERGVFVRQSTRRSSRNKGKFLKLLKRQNNSQLKSKSKKITAGTKDGKAESENANNISSSNFLSCQRINGIKELKIEVDFEKNAGNHNKNVFIESLLGMSFVSDEGIALRVSDISPEYQLNKNMIVKIGDVLKKIDDVEVNNKNIMDILNKYPLKKVAVKLVFEEYSPASNSAHNKYSEFVKYILDTNRGSSLVLQQQLKDALFSIAYIRIDELPESSSEFEGILYCYPRPEKDNFLCSCKGTFITLNHLIYDVLKQSRPQCSTIFIKETAVHIVYSAQENELMLLAAPDNKCNQFELMHITKEIIRLLEFSYQSLNNCFNNRSNMSSLDNLFSHLFSQIYFCGYGIENQQKLPSLKVQETACSHSLFEQCLGMSLTAHIPWEAQLQIDDALTELEAADYREWTDDPFDCQRLFIILGSCLYFSGHLLVSHLDTQDLVDVNTYLKIHGYLSLSRESEINKIIAWKEIFIKSCNRGVSIPETPENKNNEYKTPKGRWFMSIIGKENLLLVTILESGGAALPAIGNIQPPPFYIEECESCLDLLIDVELDKFLEQWFKYNARPQVVNQPEQLLSSKSSKDFTGFASAFVKKSPSPVTKADFLNTLKKSASDDNTLNENQQKANVKSSLWLKSTQSANVFESNCSEDSESQKSLSEISDERIQGRRKERERQLNPSSLSSDSDTEWDGYDDSQLSGSYDMSDLSQALLERMGFVIPTKITAGEENICFHFVTLDHERGVMLTPNLNTQQSESVLYKYIFKSFRNTSQKIHTLMENTKRYKKLLSPSSSINKSLVAIKEHGILFKVPTKIMNLANPSKRSSEPLCYWVIGRLFENPNCSEVYVCYHESIPQNMVEIAFRLAFGS